MAIDIVPWEMRLRIAKLLLEPATHSIRFQLNKVRITGTDYEKIAVLIHLGELQVAFGSLDLMKDSGGVAYYQGSKAGGVENVLFLPKTYQKKDWGLDEKSVIVHEATHAVLDFRKVSLRKLDSEMIAYFAQFWWGFSSGFEYSVQYPKLGEMTEIIAKGTNAVYEYRREGKVRDDTLKSFRKAIAAVPLYGDADRKMSPGDGISTNSLQHSHLGGDPLMNLRQQTAGLQDPYE